MAYWIGLFLPFIFALRTHSTHATPPGPVISPSSSATILAPPLWFAKASPCSPSRFMATLRPTLANRLLTKPAKCLPRGFKVKRSRYPVTVTTTSNDLLSRSGFSAFAFAQTSKTVMAAKCAWCTYKVNKETHRAASCPACSALTIYRYHEHETTRPYVHTGTYTRTITQ